MKFNQFLRNLRLLPTSEGFRLSLPRKGLLPDGSGYTEEYLIQARLLFENPVLADMIEQTLHLLMEGLVQGETWADVKATRLSMQTLTAFYDNLKHLHDIALEEKERKEYDQNSVNSVIEDNPYGG